jgi:NAD(P)-dependent dehydrogenase (short-subunit alcohol dehydrogenase family)
MKDNGIKFGKYFREYKIGNVLAMIKNNGRPPRLIEERADGKLVAITGATSGIGLAAARKFAAMGADLVLVNRNREKSEALKQELETAYGIQCRLILADLSRLEDSRRAAEELRTAARSIDVLIHNAGIYLTKRQLTEEGIEKVFMVNYLSTFVINQLLKETLKAQGRCRILLVCSEGHRFSAWGLRLDDLNWEKRRYAGLSGYGQAKLAQLLTMRRFDAYFKGSGVTINAMHPGAVKTETGQDNGRLYKWFKRNSLDKALKPVSIAAEALYTLGISRDLEGVSGKFFNLTTLEEPAPPALDDETAGRLWEASLALARLED